MALSTLACNVSSIIQPIVPTVEPTRVLAPTFTPTPDTVAPLIVVTPPRDGSPGVIIIQPTIDADKVVVQIPPTETPIPPPATPVPQDQVVPPPPVSVETPQPPVVTTPGAVLPTPTPELPPTPTFTPSPTATPYILVESGYVALRLGPGIEYPLVAQLGPSIPIAVVSRNTEGSWYEICCVNGYSVWVAATHVRLVNDISQTPLVVAPPPPAPTPTYTPTWTPTVTLTPTSTPYPFERAIGPQFFPTENQFLTLWAYLFVGTLTDPARPEEPVPGYCVDVKFEGFDRTGTNASQPSTDKVEYNLPEGWAGRVKYNFKYEFRPPDPKKENPLTTDTPLTLLGTGTWTAFVTDCAGHQLSEPITFTTSPGNPNREVYVGWVRTH
jgi:hypothetical protein